MAEALEMTALERATAAFVAELERQSDAGKPGPYFENRPDGILIDGTVDASALIRAVLQAIREPSGELLECIHGRSTVTDWKAMIDAALIEIDSPAKP